MRTFNLSFAQRQTGRCALIFLLLALNACDPPSENTPTDPAPAADKKAAAAPALVALSEAAIANARLAWQSAGPQKISQSRNFPGQIALDQHHVQAVAAKVSGQVRQVDKHPGQPVRAGEVLAVIESQELADLRLAYRQQQSALKLAEQQLARENTLSTRIQQLMQQLTQGGTPASIHQAAMQLQIGEHKARLLDRYAQLKLAQQSLERERGLIKDQLSTTETLQNLEQALASAQAAYSGALEAIRWERESLLLSQRQHVTLARQALESQAAKLRSLGVDPAAQLPPDQLARLVVYAPQQGMVVEKPVTEGQGVSADQTLYVLADLSQVWAEVQVYESDLNAVRLGQVVQVVAVDLELIASSRISHIKPLVDAVSRAAEAHAYLENSRGQWRPGMYVNVRVQSGEVQVPVAVRRSALQTLDGQTVLFVRTPAGFALRQVKLGRQDGNWAEVTEGLKAGEVYVHQNSFTLKSALLSQEGK
ncbi:MAG: efflux RND transporter periplasmic adaptor subunit [Candidatus Sericytochromatia bacterium]|nr:efflux RND transporter periplasmic adaptor subunit [Candidatus Sericytochromatia bacterium]